MIYNIACKVSLVTLYCRLFELEWANLTSYFSARICKAITRNRRIGKSAGCKEIFPFRNRTFMIGNFYFFIVDDTDIAKRFILIWSYPSHILFCVEKKSYNSYCEYTKKCFNVGFFRLFSQIFGSGFITGYHIFSK